MVYNTAACLPATSDGTGSNCSRSNNEHTELIKGTPWLRFWPRSGSVKDGRKRSKRSTDVELRSVGLPSEGKLEQCWKDQPGTDRGRIVNKCQ